MYIKQRFNGLQMFNNLVESTISHIEKVAPSAQLQILTLREIISFLQKNQAPQQTSVIMEFKVSEKSLVEDKEVEIKTPEVFQQIFAQVKNHFEELNKTAEKSVEVEVEDEVVDVSPEGLIALVKCFNGGYSFPAGFDKFEGLKHYIDYRKGLLKIKRSSNDDNVDERIETLKDQYKKQMSVLVQKADKKPN